MNIVRGKLKSSIAEARRQERDRAEEIQAATQEKRNELIPTINYLLMLQGEEPFECEEED